MSEVEAVARAYLAAGLSVIPVRADVKGAGPVANCELTPADEVSTFLEHLAPIGSTRPGTVIELRALRMPGTSSHATWCGYYDLGARKDRDALIDSVTMLSSLDREQQPEGVYVTMNPLETGLLNRSRATFSEARFCASDADVIARRWLVIGTAATSAAAYALMDSAGHKGPSFAQKPRTASQT